MSADKKFKVSYDQAACMFYALEYNLENVRTSVEMLSHCKATSLVYTNDPEDPLLMSNAKINIRPLTYKKYIQDIPESSTRSPISALEEIEDNLTDVQLVEVLNTLFVYEDPGSDTLYKPISISSSSIIKMLATHLRPELLNPKEFGKWCSRQKVNLINGELKVHKNVANGKQKERQRLLYMLKPEYQDQAIAEVKNYLAVYREELQGLKSEGIELLGYVRKSPGCEEDSDARLRLLQQMVDRLYERSRVQSVFVSPVCKSNVSLSARDLPRPVEILKKLTSIQGSCQDLLAHLKMTKNKVCIVALDYAGLSTNSSDIYEFVYNNSCVQHIVIDLMPSLGKVTIFNRAEVLARPGVLEAFSCRTPGPVKRSQ